MQHELYRLRAENAHLKELLSRHGIAWEEEVPGRKAESALSTADSARLSFTVSEKISLFRRLFSGRDDVYPRRWESSSKGTSGYSPVCGNEWKRALCGKPKVKCADCPNRNLQPLTDQVVYDHLSGKHTIGVYPLLKDDTCRFLAADFDDADWMEDAASFIRVCREMEIPSALEISRSGKGAHIWIFFAEPVPAKEARLLGTALLSRTCEKTRQLSLTSYDRLFPNQDCLPKGGFGNLIALPLQKLPRSRGHSVFVDDHFQAYSDQWAFLASLRPIMRHEVESAILKICGNRHPLDVKFVTEEENSCPWCRPEPQSVRIPGTLPESLRLILAEQIYIAKESLTQPLANRLIRLAAFQNPEFFKAQAMRLPVWNKPRIIGCAENHSSHISLPRGCLKDIQTLLYDNDIKVEIQDERISGQRVDVKFTGILSNPQKSAVKELLLHDFGVLCAPTAFGKTVSAASMIARRKCSALVLVHRADLLRQWTDRLKSFLSIDDDQLGYIGGGKNKLTGIIDIAVMQSLVRNSKMGDILDRYGHVIVDECHHISAFSFESILRQVKSRFILGLTATPIRRDGLHPIIFMQCGPIRHKATPQEKHSLKMDVLSIILPSSSISPDAPIQQIFHELIHDQERNRRIAEAVTMAYVEGRKVLVLTERAGHIPFLAALLGSIENLFILHGRMTKKKRHAVYSEINELSASTPRVILATGRLIGEGFDHPPLDTLVLAMPVSWKGTLQQYAGRLHRKSIHKKDIRIYDYVEEEHLQLERMWNKRLKGYKSMGYEVRMLGAKDESDIHSSENTGFSDCP